MHRDVICLAALDFVLRIVLARVMRVSFLVNIFCVHLYDFAADVSGLRVPGHVNSDFEFPCQMVRLRLQSLPQRSSAFPKGGHIDNNRAHKLDPCQLPLPEEREHVGVKSAIESACRLSR